TDAQVEAAGVVVRRLTTHRALFGNESGCHLRRLVTGGRSSALLGGGAVV
ncbi:hypothetical protein HN51_003731, partial [Arachis hypogaea]